MVRRLMRQWTPDHLFLFTYCVSALCGLADLVRSHRPLTVRSVLGTILVCGAIGCGLGMLLYDYADGANHPWRVVGPGMLFGVRVIRVDDVKEIVRRLLGLEKGNKK